MEDRYKYWMEQAEKAKTKNMRRAALLMANTYKKRNKLKKLLEA